MQLEEIVSIANFQKHYPVQAIRQKLSDSINSECKKESINKNSNENKGSLTKYLHDWGCRKIK